MATKTKNKKKGSNAIAKVNPNEMAVYDYGDDAGVGIDDIGRDEMAIPFIGILQSNNGEILPVKKGGIEGAEVGMLINTVTKEVFDGDKGLLFVPSARAHEYVEWVPRSKGGGFVGIHSVGSEVVAEAMSRAQAENADFGKFTTPDGNDLVETYYLYGVILDDDGIPTGIGVIAFTSTKIKKYKHLNTRLKSIKGRPSLFAIQLRICTVPDSNKKGDFINFDIQFAVDNTGTLSLLDPNSEAYASAKVLRDGIASGEAKADYASTDNDSAVGGDDAAF